MKPCTCPMGLTCCDMDRPRCPDFHAATYRELEWYGDLMREMAEPIDWLSYFTDGARERSEPMSEGEANMIATDMQEVGR